MGPGGWAASGAWGRCWTHTTGMAGRSPKAGTASTRLTSGLRSPRLQCESQTGELSAIEDEWHGAAWGPA